MRRDKKHRKDFLNIPISEIEEAFEIDIEPGEGMLEKMRTEMSDKFFDFTENIIEPILSSNNNLCCMFERNMLDEKDTEEIFEIYKKIQSLKWEHNLLLLKKNENKTAEWIKKTWELWDREIQGKLVDICEKFSSGWKKTKITEEETSYHL